ncbi:hypothetical protein [Lewinella sp. LCG006]|uniref:hypothetical protein n=1 Tax=Lewinella sp. LCG006 TaxID=3231911 RepID=UPI00346152BC
MKPIIFFRSQSLQQGLLICLLCLFFSVSGTSQIVQPNQPPVFNQPTTGSTSFGTLNVSPFNTQIYSCNTSQSYCADGDLKIVTMQQTTSVSPKFAILIKPQNGIAFSQLHVFLRNPQNGVTEKIQAPDILAPGQHNFRDASAWLLKIELDNYYSKGITVEPGQPIVEVYMEGLQGNGYLNDHRKLQIKN